MFSQVAGRLHTETNALYSLRDSLRAKGTAILDLVSGNVNDQGLVYPPDLLADIMRRASLGCGIYRPDSFGQETARQAISTYYVSRNVPIPADCLVLTPGTSIAYWYCFKLLADEGDEVLCPSPTYPLFDYIAALSGVRLISYRLGEEREWCIDLEGLEANISTRTRAIVLISPHNPTGHVSSREEIDAVSDIAMRHDLAIISDEVFSEFLMDGGILPRPAATKAPLVITLNGFSKMFALPGIKLGWMAVTGQRDKARRALRALELISDTFLPVNEMAQAAAPEIFREGQDFLASYAREIRERWTCADSVLQGSTKCSCVKPAGGFYVTLSLRGLDEEKAAEALLRDGGLLVHPGFFYDMAPAHLVLSFVQKPDVLHDVLPRMLRILESL